MKNLCMACALVITLVTGISFAPADSMAVPVKKDAAASQQLTEKININSADSELLTTIPGIGPKTALAIAAYREDNGKFKSVDELVNIKGIGAKKLEKIRSYLTI